MTDMTLLSTTAAGIALVHTLAGPDHYVPFVAMGQARRWSMAKTLRVTILCGLGHVAGSVGVGLFGVGIGWMVGQLESVQAARATLAAWMLIAFGLTYLVVGVIDAIRNLPHSHLHVHLDGTVHAHEHRHNGGHVHGHDDIIDRRPGLVPWVLFVLFVFGPCEPLIPLLIVPGLEMSWGCCMAVCCAYTTATTLTMVACVYGLSRVTASATKRYCRRTSSMAHVWSGVAILTCGILMNVGF